MWLVFIFIIILGIITIRIRVNIIKIVVNGNEINFKVKVDIMIFGLIKICSIYFFKDYFKIFHKKLFYMDFIDKSRLKRLKEDARNIKISKIKNWISLIELKMIKVKFNLKIGFEDIFISNFLVVILSIFIAISLSNNVNKKNQKKVKYQILPEFNKNEFNYNGNIIFVFKLKNVILIYYKNRKKKKVHNNIKNHARKEIKIYE